MGLPNFHHHPQGNIYIRTASGIYNDTFQNFNTDLQSVGGRSYAGLPSDCIERYYEPNVKSYLIEADYDQRGDFGFSDGDYYISLVHQLKSAKQAREEGVVG